MAYNVHIQEIDFINHNVLQIKTDKPSDFKFTPGQATELSIDQPKWKDEKRPFTFTSLPQDEFLEFTVKVYPEHNGVTDQLQTLEKGDSLCVGDAWGSISYKGPGVFLAGGAGVTPFIAILRDLARKGAVEGNKLIFGNQRERDILLPSTFEKWLGQDFINILSDEQHSNYPHGIINKQFIKEKVRDMDQYFYLCGPPPMMESVREALNELNVSSERIIAEDFD